MIARAFDDVVVEASILSADPARLADDLAKAADAGVPDVQLDMMDGQFVPNITFGPDFVAGVRAHVRGVLDVHMMVVDPERFFEPIVHAGADRIFVHEEACRDPSRTLAMLRRYAHNGGGREVEVGLSINPGTPLARIEDLLDFADVFQVMTVSPGFGGQALIPRSLDKVRRLRTMLDARGMAAKRIAVDGGIAPSTIRAAYDAGARILVSGSSLFSGGDVVANVAKLRAALEG